MKKNKKLYKYILSDIQTSKINLINNVFNVFTLSFELLSYIFKTEIKNTQLNDYFLNKFDTINFVIKNIDENIEKVKKVIDDSLYEICDFTEISLIEENFEIDKNFLINLGFKTINIFHIGKKSLLKRILNGIGVILVGLCEIIIPIVFLGLLNAYKFGFLEFGIETIFYGIKIIFGKKNFNGWKNFFKNQLKNFSFITIRLLTNTLSQYAINYLKKIGLAKFVVNEKKTTERYNENVFSTKNLMNQINDKLEEDLVYKKIINSYDFSIKFNEFIIYNISKIFEDSLNEYLKIINDIIYNIFNKIFKNEDSKKFKNFSSHSNMILKNLIEDFIYSYKEITQKNYSELIDDILNNLMLYSNKSINGKNLIDIIVSDEFNFKNMLIQSQFVINPINYLLLNQKKIEEMKLFYKEIFENFINKLKEMEQSEEFFNKFVLKYISFNIFDEIFHNKKMMIIIHQNLQSK